jgi:hypothetical protein
MKLQTMSEESTVATQGLLKWLFNADLNAVTIKKVSESNRAVRLQISYATQIYLVDVVSIEYANRTRGMY